MRAATVYTCLLVLMALAAFVYGSGCVYDGVEFKSGEKHHPKGKCTEITCNADGGISQIGCALAALSPNCKVIPEDLSKPYPSCCESYECH